MSQFSTNGGRGVSGEAREVSRIYRSPPSLLDLAHTLEFSVGSMRVEGGCEVLRSVLRGTGMKMILEWMEVMRVERVSLWKVVGMVWVFRTGVVWRKEERERRVGVCGRCPLYNGVMRQCRPFPGHRLGCGCYVPLLVWVRRPYEKGCWGRSFVGIEGFGWE